VERWNEILVYAKLNHFVLKNDGYKKKNYYIYYTTIYIYIYDYTILLLHHILQTLIDPYILPPNSI